jgi:hypothetical protein
VILIITILLVVTPKCFNNEIVKCGGLFPVILLRVGKFFIAVSGISFYVVAYRSRDNCRDPSTT